MAGGGVASEELTRDSVAREPVAQFEKWFAQARAAEGVVQAEAMVLASVSVEGAPSQRTVLMKGVDAEGVVFFTNHGSRKGREMGGNGAVSLLFPWYALQRQVLIEGEVERISQEDSRAYFHSRPREAQLGAWASRQSEVLESREVLVARVAEVTERFAGGEVPLPPFWGGYRVRPHRFEFWQGREHRLHERILYTRGEGGGWEISRLSP